MKHLLLDLKTRDLGLADVEYLTTMLNQLVDLIGMTKLLEPTVIEVSDGANSGVTGFVVIMESHISIHTWPEKGKAYIDIFSCRDFDQSQVLRYVENYLVPSHMKITEIKRMDL